jgi:hypothetical protein
VAAWRAISDALSGTTSRAVGDAGGMSCGTARRAKIAGSFRGDECAFSKRKTITLRVGGLSARKRGDVRRDAVDPPRAHIASGADDGTDEPHAIMTAHPNDFRDALRERFTKAHRKGQDTLDVSAADLCLDSKSENDASTCRAYMRAAMGLRDRIVESTTSEHGETLTVRYMLPHTLP